MSDNGGLSVWATHDTVRLHVNREDVDLAVDFIPADAEPFFQSVRDARDGLAFGCVQDDRGMSLGSIGVVFCRWGAVPTMDFLLQFAGEQATGSVRPEALEMWLAGMHDACVYAKSVAHPAWDEVDNGIIKAAYAATSLGISPITPMRRLNDAITEMRRHQSA
jgi:hypothetical protein